MKIARIRDAAVAVTAAAGLLMSGTVSAGPDDAPRLRTLERELNQAIVERDVRRVDDLLSDDWVLITGAGAIKTKQEMLAEIARPELEYQDNDTRDVLVRIWGDTAVITGTLHQRYRLRGQQQDVTLRYTGTWTRSGDSWRQVSGHATRLP